MDILSAEFITAVISIVIIDLVLAGDNAIVIGMAARNLKPDTRKQVIILGTLGAVVVRILATLAVVQLLKIPFLKFIGGIILVWIAYKLLIAEDDPEVKSANSKWEAVATIIVADITMGLDNVLAVAGAAHGSFLLVVVGLLISVPIIIWGSTIVSALMNKYPVIIYIGAAVLAFTAARMIVEDPKIAPFIAPYPIVHWGFIVALVAAILILGARSRKKQYQQEA